MRKRTLTISVPLNTKALTILSRYKGKQAKLLPTKQIYQYNEGIRSVLKECGINRMVTILDTVTGNEVQKPICDVATSHMARRNFIGNLYKQVKDPNLVGKLSGHAEGSRAFARYRDICRNSEVQPILFFNEADAIFNKRSENIQHSVDKMENAMQNIILQEMEDLDGILIATTNLTSNLDNAFERRFLYKVEFHKPDTDVKTQIWCSMLKDLSTDDARHLASRFDFSGGQIENIARKRAVDYILSGKEATLDEIEDYCRAELLSGKERRSIGFIS